MSDDESDADPAVEREAADEDDAGTDIPISTGGTDSGRTNDPTDTAGEARADEGIEIDVETGSPGPDVERRSREETEIEFGSSGGVFDRLDESIVTLLSRVLDTETHLRVYVALRRRPWSTAEEIAEEAGLYPRAVRDALDALEARDAVTRRRGSPGETDTSVVTNAAGTEGGDGDDSDGSGGNWEYDPEYAAVPPSAVLTGAVSGTGRGLSEGLDLDRYLRSEPMADAGDPIRIDVEDDRQPEEADDLDSSESGADDADERDATGGTGTDTADGHDG